MPGCSSMTATCSIPKRFLVNPPEIRHTLIANYLVANGHFVSMQSRETQKYGHVTYFWNGNKCGKFDDELETFEEIPSDVVPFEQRPWMKCAEITDDLIEAMARVQIIRLPALQLPERRYGRPHRQPADAVDRLRGRTGSPCLPAS